jgi:hypothetical protein
MADELIITLPVPFVRVPRFRKWKASRILRQPKLLLMLLASASENFGVLMRTRNLPKGGGTIWV